MELSQGSPLWWGKRAILPKGHSWELIEKKEILSTNIQSSLVINIINLRHQHVSPYRSSEIFFGGKKCIPTSVHYSLMSSY